MKAWKVCVIADDPYCGADMLFHAETVEKEPGAPNSLRIDGKLFIFTEGYTRLEEMK